MTPSPAPLCPDCGHRGTKAIYYGLPICICNRHAVPVLWSFWPVDPIVGVLPFSERLLVYSGGYWRALWAWLRGGKGQEKGATVTYRNQDDSALPPEPQGDKEENDE